MVVDVTEFVCVACLRITVRVGLTIFLFGRVLRAAQLLLHALSSALWFKQQGWLFREWYVHAVCPSCVRQVPPLKGGGMRVSANGHSSSAGIGGKNFVEKGLTC